MKQRTKAAQPSKPHWQVGGGLAKLCVGFSFFRARRMKILPLGLCRFVDSALVKNTTERERSGVCSEAFVFVRQSE